MLNKTSAVTIRRHATKARLTAALLCVGVALLVMFARPASAVVTTSVGIDADPGATPANTATTLGSIEPCRSVNNGDVFTVDFFINFVPSPGIDGFQGDLNYDATRLKVTANDVNLMLGTNAGSSVTDFTPDSLSDTFTPAAVDFGVVSGHSETGSGVLARVTFQAIANGVATLTLTNVVLIDPYGAPIGDTDGDGVFDGAISNAVIAIGDADCDGFIDTAPTQHQGPANTNTTVDNCVAVYNPDQANRDGNFIDLHVYGKTFDDLTAPGSDALGDACDPDKDNDGLANSDELNLGPGGAAHALCAAATAATDPLKADTDGDRVLDRAECALGTDPANAASKPPAAPAGDTDHDGITDAFEATIGTNPAKADTDGDLILDGVEYKGYNINPLALNTDGDTCSDGKEIASVNADLTVDTVDQSVVAAAQGTAPGPPYILAFDLNKDGYVNSTDLAIQGRQLGAC
jgi:hypothetical protein